MRTWNSGNISITTLTISFGIIDPGADIFSRIGCRPCFIAKVSVNSGRTTQREETECGVSFNFYPDHPPGSPGLKKFPAQMIEGEATFFSECSGPTLRKGFSNLSNISNFISKYS